MSALAPCVAPPLGRGLGGGLGTHANQASIPESQDQQASVANGKPPRVRWLPRTHPALSGTPPLEGNASGRFGGSR